MGAVCPVQHGPPGLALVALLASPATGGDRDPDRAVGRERVAPSALLPESRRPAPPVLPPLPGNPDRGRFLVRAVHVNGPGPRPWRGGEEQRLGDELYLLYDDASETTDPGRSWSWLVATADRVEPTSERVRLRRLCLLRDTPEATELAQAVRAQAALLSAAAGEAGLPLLLGVHERPDTVTVVSRLPLGPTWHEVFGPGNSPLDRLTAAAVLDAAARLCDTLDTLHRRRHAHRALSPDAIVMVGRSRDPMLRDIGLAAIPARQGEVPAAYRAPEQARGGPHLSAPGPHTDLYQVAALAYHTLTGHSPSPMASPPVRAGLPGFPADLDDVLARALDQDPRRRPGGIRSLGAALRRGRKELSRGGRP